MYIYFYIYIYIHISKLNDWFQNRIIIFVVVCVSYFAYAMIKVDLKCVSCSGYVKTPKLLNKFTNRE